MVDQGVQYLYESFGCCQDRDPIFIAIDIFWQTKREICRNKYLQGGKIIPQNCFYKLMREKVDVEVNN